MANLFTYRTTQPEDMKKAPDPIGDKNRFRVVALRRFCPEYCCYT
ncbi:DUF1643 domain-containing protein [Vibrio rarus]